MNVLTLVRALRSSSPRCTSCDSEDFYPDPSAAAALASLAHLTRHSCRRCRASFWLPAWVLHRASPATLPGSAEDLAPRDALEASRIDSAIDVHVRASIDRAQLELLDVAARDWSAAAADVQEGPALAALDRSVTAPHVAADDLTALDRAFEDARGSAAGTD